MGKKSVFPAPLPARPNGDSKGLLNAQISTFHVMLQP
jgi:hypothetical protein